MKLPQRRTKVPAPPSAHAAMDEAHDQIYVILARLGAALVGTMLMLMVTMGVLALHLWG